MHHWLQLATRNWRVKPGRTAAILLAVALGVGTVVTVTTIYASVEATIAEQIVENWLGRSHVSIESPHGHWGSVDERLAAQVAKLDEVKEVGVRFKTRMNLLIPPGAGVLPRDAYTGTKERVEIDVVGIDPRVEYDFRSFSKLVGRRIEPGDRHVIILDERLAADLGLAVGDTVKLEAYLDEPPEEVKIIGLMDSRRIAVFQKPTAYMQIDDVQAMRGEPNKVSVIDCIVRKEDPQYIEAAADHVRHILANRRQGYLVTTATGKLKQLLEAQRATRIMLLLFAFIALLTSFFIIITTMSMGMMERVRQLGTMRCLGMTRRQLAALVYAEVLPLGIIGVLLGLPVGMGLTKLGVAYMPYIAEWVHEPVMSRWGITLAVVGGLVTTFAGATAILLHGANVSPLRAVNPQARADRTGAIFVAAFVGAALLIANALMIDYVPPTAWYNATVVFTSTATLYGGYMLLAPALVIVAGTAALTIAAPLLGIRRKLAQDQMGRAPWRSAGVCWTLMVGLSLIVYFFVRGESITHAWDFPARLAGAFVWTQQPIPLRKLDEVADLPGVGEITPINDVICKIQPKHTSILSMLTSQSVFAAGDPDTFLSMAKLDFLQGNLDDARAKLKRGGYILMPPEASHSFGYNLGDKVPITIGGKTVEFEVAGVVRSPAMDIAVSYFQADSYMMLASASSVLGTIADLEKYFGIDTISMFLFNVNLPPTEPPAEFKAKEPPVVDSRWLAEHMKAWAGRLPHEQKRLGGAADELGGWPAGGTPRPSPALRRELLRYSRSLRDVKAQWNERTAAQRWELFREWLTIEHVKEYINRPGSEAGSLRRLKQDIDSDIRMATLIISSIPMISLLVASIGVANLMMVNVQSRARQIAILRSIGSTKSQIARLVLVEALVLGLLGSAVGVLLGLHSAAATNALTARLIGINVPWVVPWPRVIGAVLLTWAICLCAGIGPALRASRRNVIGALQTA